MNTYSYDNIKTDIYVVVNPKSGSYDDAIYATILNTIQTNFSSRTISDVSTNIVLENKSESKLETKIETKLYRIIELKTSYVNHALKMFSQLSIKDLSNIHLIIIIGGDGIVHEVVNGLFNNPCNEEWKNIFPTMCVCPLGSGNHLAKLIGTESIDKFYNAMSLFILGESNQKYIIPNVVENNENNSINKKILSINTIVVGTPAIINDKASRIVDYLPRILSPLKYEIGTMFGIFDREYFIIDAKNGDIIDNIIGLFVQLTPSCGNNFIVDKRVNGTEKGLSYAYIRDVNTVRLIYEFTKERAGYESTELIKKYDTNNELELNAYIDTKIPTLTIDGQSEKIQFPVIIKKYTQSLTFLSTNN